MIEGKSMEEFVANGEGTETNGASAGTNGKGTGTNGEGTSANGKGNGESTSGVEGEGKKQETFSRLEVETLSRRQFLTGAVAGGAAGLAVAAGTGVAVWQIGESERQVVATEAEDEIARLQGLVDRYEDLEKVGLDSILMTGMQALALPLAVVETGAQALVTGLEWTEKALLSLQEALPSAEESLIWLENQVSTVAGSIEKTEVAIGNALEKATDNPVAEALSDFASLVLDNLPFGLGDKIRGVLDELVNLLTSVDDLVKGINSQILEPLRQQWFASEEGQGMGATFMNPLVEHILDPLEAHLEDLVVLADTWQQELAAPAQDALAQRETIRQDILEYKKDNGFL